ncbi:CYFA0S16e01244g1_1 [Cyberlindnera fabianii]|uniref:CYFA0S16e01244g1_1 n=1 Tax=Cyberlindnera fabianii TaxID=36022 RepID=A0A061BAY4_CYBFA|nr:CYFA0S16e01244g1_1 [Cyberlindnera fabianii]
MPTSPTSHPMAREHNLQQPKSSPVQSPLTQSTKKLRIPQSLTSSQKRFSHLPVIETESSLRKKSTSPDESPFNDKKRLVDQFYELSSGTATPNAITPGTPFISRSNTMDDLKDAKGSFGFLKHAYGDDSMIGDEEHKSHMRKSVLELESEVTKRVKHRVEESGLEMHKTTTQFDGMQAEIRQIKDKVNVYVSLLKSKSATLDNDYGQLEAELAKLYSTLSVLDQYELAVETSRQKMLTSKKKLQQLTQIVEITEKQNTKERENVKVRRKWILLVTALLLLVFLLSYLF